MSARATDVARTFLRWTCLRAVFHRGYVLVSTLYFVLDAHLSASQLLVLGTVVSGTLLLSDIPTGVSSDALSRKWPLVIGHVFIAGGMVMTGLVTAFPLLVVTQVLWGLGWGFSSGADVAWITDELDRPDRIARVLTARARWDLVGGATGTVAFGALGWAAGLTKAILVSGVAMALLGLFVAMRFAEDNFIPAREQRWSASRSIFRRGVTLARRDHEILLVLAATMIVSGASMVSWLFPKQLIDRGFPDDPVLWYTALGILAFAVGAVALRIVEARIDGVGVARRIYALACLVGVLGLIVLAFAPTALLGSIGVLLAGGVAFNVTRAVGVIWVNRRTTSDVRATVHSFLSQAECAGKVVSGFALAGLAGRAGIATTLVTAAALVAIAGALVARSRADRRGGRMHDDEVATDAALVRRVLAAQFPEWAELPVQHVPSSGTDNALYRLGVDMVVRLPRIHWAVGGVAKDFRWLPAVAALLPVAIPAPLAKGAPAEGYPWEWGVYSWLEGENPTVGRIADADALAREVARFVQALHRIDLADGPPASRGVPLAMRDEPTRAALAELDGMIDTESATAAWDAALRVPEWVGPPVWVHGDVAPGNLLLQGGRLTGVIDFGGLGVGDPACDLIVAWNTLPADARGVFRAELAVDDATWARGRGWALSVALIQLPYYKDTNPALAANARHVIREVLADYTTEEGSAS